MKAIIPTSVGSFSSLSSYILVHRSFFFLLSTHTMGCVGAISLSALRSHVWQVWGPYVGDGTQVNWHEGACCTIALAPSHGCINPVLHQNYLRTLRREEENIKASSFTYSYNLDKDDAFGKWQSGTSVTTSCYGKKTEINGLHTAP